MADDSLINGVSFEEWGSACGRIMQGTPLEDVMRVLGLEKPVWDETNKRWGERLGDMMRADINVGRIYGEIFASPNRGRFAKVKARVADMDELLRIVPDFNQYQKILTHQSVAAKYGIDPVTVIEGYGLDMGKWGSLNMHYIEVQNQMLSDNRTDEFVRVNQAWTSHWEQHYAANRVDLGKDIEF